MPHQGMILVIQIRTQLLSDKHKVLRFDIRKTEIKRNKIDKVRFLSMELLHISSSIIGKQSPLEVDNTYLWGGIRV